MHRDRGKWRSWSYSVLIATSGPRSGDAGVTALGCRLVLGTGRGLFLFFFDLRHELGAFRLFHHAADHARGMFEMLLEHLAGGGIACQSQFHDLLVLFADRRIDIGVNDEAAPIALELIIKDVAEMQQPGRAAAGLESLVERAVAPFPFIVERVRLAMSLVLQLVQLVIGGDNRVLPIVAALADRSLQR